MFSNLTCFINGIPCILWNNLRALSMVAFIVFLLIVIIYIGKNK